MLNYILWEQVKVDDKIVSTDFPFEGVLVRNKQSGEYRWYFENLKGLSNRPLSEDAAKLIIQSRRMWA